MYNVCMYIVINSQYLSCNFVLKPREIVKANTNAAIQPEQYSYNTENSFQSMACCRVPRGSLFIF